MNLVQQLDVRNYDPFRISYCNSSNIYSDQQYYLGTLPTNSHLYTALTTTPSTTGPVLDDRIFRYSTQLLSNQQQFEMQVVRFPTPPITPPKHEIDTYIDLSEPFSSSSSSSSPSQSSRPEHQHQHPHQVQRSINQRNFSVIMKADQEHCHRQSLPVDSLHLSMGGSQSCKNDDVIDVEMTTQDTTSNDSSQSMENICGWMDCQRFFNTLESLAAHVTQAHAIPNNQDGLYYCHWKGCLRQDRGFNARYKMLVHVRTHTKEKPHHCHLCEKSFSRAENLKIHIRSHSGEKPYICGYEGCNKAYSNSSDRFKHTRTHNEQKPYVCKIEGCNKRYTDPSSLRKHVKTFKHGMQLISENIPICSNNNNNNNTNIKEIEKSYNENDDNAILLKTNNFKPHNLLPSTNHPHISSAQPFIKVASLETYDTSYSLGYLKSNCNDKPLDLRINRR